jgi:hypothetical protein
MTDRQMAIIERALELHGMGDELSDAWQTLKAAVLAPPPTDIKEVSPVCKEAMSIIRDIYALHRDLLDKLGELETVVLAQQPTAKDAML